MKSLGGHQSQKVITSYPKITMSTLDPRLDSISPLELDTTRRENSNSDHLNISIGQYALLTKAVQKWRLSTPSRRLELLKKHNFTKFNDKATDQYIKLQKSNTPELIFNKIVNNVCQIPNLAPHSQWRLVWDILNVFSILYFAFYIPLSVMVLDELHSTDFQLLDIIFSMILLLDIPIQMNSAYYEKWALINEKTKIIRNYIKNWSLIDIVPLISISFATSLNGSDWKWVGLLFYLKIKVLEKKVHDFEYYFVIKRNVGRILRLCSLQIKNVFIIHVLACCWANIHQIQIEEDISTLWTDGKQFKSVYELYLLSFYFVTTTMTSVGYGDLSGKNNLEHFLSILTMLISTGAFAYSISLIGSIVVELNQDGELRKKRMFIISTYMKQKGINNALQNDIREYLSYIDENDNLNNHFEEEKIISQIPKVMQSKLRKEVYALILKLFIPLFSKEFIEKFMDIITERNYRPHETIYQPSGTESDYITLFVVNKGKCELIPPNERSPHHVLTSGSIYGQVEFFNGKKISSTLKCLEFTQVFLVKRYAFLQLIKGYPDDYQRFCQIKDQILCNQDFSSLPLRCYICRQKHQVKECGVIHYDRMLATLKCKSKAYQDKYQEEQNREPFPQARDIQKKYSVFENLYQIEEEQLEIQEDYPLELEKIYKESVRFADQNIVKCSIQLFKLEQKQIQDLLQKQDLLKEQDKKKRLPKMSQNSIGNLINNEDNNGLHQINESNSQSFHQQEKQQNNQNLITLRRSSTIDVDAFQFANPIQNRGSIISAQKQQKGSIISAQKQLKGSIVSAQRPRPQNTKFFCADDNFDEENMNLVVENQLIKLSFKESVVKMPRSDKTEISDKTEVTRPKRKTKQLEVNTINFNNSFLEQTTLYSPTKLPGINPLQSMSPKHSMFKKDSIKHTPHYHHHQQKKMLEQGFEKMVYSQNLRANLIVGNQQIPFMLEESFDKIHSWNKYYKRFNYDIIAKKYNELPDKKIREIIFRIRSAQQRIGSTQIKMPQRSFSQTNRTRRILYSCIDIDPNTQQTKQYQNSEEKKLSLIQDSSMEQE